MNIKIAPLVITALLIVNAKMTIADEQQLKVTCTSAIEGRLDITLKGKTPSNIKEVYLQIIAIPSNNLITDSRTNPVKSDGTPTNEFSLFVSPYSPKTTNIEVIANIRSVNNKVTKMTTGNGCY